MRLPFGPAVRFSIPLKLLLFVLPLVCMPIAIVGYFSYEASIESVTRLSRNEQMLQATAAASQINGVFESCCTDLETISEYVPSTERHFRADEDKDGDAKRTAKLLRDFSARSPYRLRIGLLNRDVRAPSSPREASRDPLPILAARLSSSSHSEDEERGCRISKIAYSSQHQTYLFQFLRDVFDRHGRPAGTLVMDVDFGKVIDLIKAIRFGKQGFAFLVDESGRIIAHPFFKPYEYDLTKYDDPRFREFVVDMIAGESGWRTYNYFGETAAAFAPVPATKWSLAVTIPFDEFKGEARSIRARMLEVVVMVLILSGIGVSLLSYQILKPVRRMAVATEKMAAGDLWQEIPVRSRDELGALTRSFNRMVRNLREAQTELIRSEKLASMGRLSAGVAHEVRNPLNAMKGAVFYLQKQRSEDNLVKEYTQLILEEIERLSLFVTEFLYFARQSPPTLVQADLNGIIKACLSLSEEEFRGKGIDIVTDLDPSLPPIGIDVRQMEQVFLNLLINAVHAMPHGGVLKVSTLVENRTETDGKGLWATAEIEDNGTGITEAHLKSVFDPFFSTKEGGTGLGLPISLGIVENHGGAMEIASRENAGTKVTVRLPAGTDS